jgi:chromosomal replication initiator protein
MKTHYNFDDFIEGDCNRLARSFALDVADNPGSSLLNPLIICGEIGSGKTFLAQAIYNRIRQDNPVHKVKFMKITDFCSEFCNALKNNRKGNYFNAWQNQDTLILDDVCYLVGKSNTQEELARFLIDRYLYSQKHVVMTSSVFPDEYAKFEPRFASLLESAVTGILTNPSYETRLTIIRTGLESIGIQIAENVLEHLAAKISGTVRHFENVTISIIASASRMNKAVDIDLIDNILNKIQGEGRHHE